MNDRDKMALWLGKSINKDYLYYDMIHKHFDYILNYLNSKNIKLHEQSQKDVFLIRFIAFLYQNSRINI